MLTLFSETGNEYDGLRELLMSREYGSKTVSRRFNRLQLLFERNNVRISFEPVFRFPVVIGVEESFFVVKTRIDRWCLLNPLFEVLINGRTINLAQ